MRKYFPQMLSENNRISYFRDQYVRINFENIQSGKEHNFDAKSPSAVLLYGDYDFGSVMHYSRCAFTSNNMETITAAVGVIFQSETMQGRHILCSISGPICNAWSEKWHESVGCQQAHGFL